MRKVVILLILLPLIACEVNSPVKYKPTDPEDEHAIENMSDLFIPGEEAGIVNFKTNDSQYYTTRGFTLWCLLEEVHIDFNSREVEVSKLTGNISAGYGLVYCYRNDPEYGKTMLVVMINTEKEYIAAEVTDNVFQTLIPWKESAFLKAGYNQCNAIRLEYNDASSDYFLYLNNQLETAFRDDEAPFHTSGQQGYMVVISPLDDFPTSPVEIQFKEK